MNLPLDPVMLLSVINTNLRDRYPSLTALCEDNNLDIEEIKKKLQSIDYTYNEELNQFK